MTKDDDPAPTKHRVHLVGASLGTGDLLTEQHPLEPNGRGVAGVCVGLYVSVCIVLSGRERETEPRLRGRDERDERQKEKEKGLVRERWEREHGAWRGPTLSPSLRAPLTPLTDSSLRRRCPDRAATNDHRPR